MQKTALLVMDYQVDILSLVEKKASALLGNAWRLIEAARGAAVPVIFVQVAFRPGYPEVSPRNKAFAGIRQTRRFELGRPGTAIHPELNPRQGEAVVVKHRVGAFTSTDLATILRAQGLEQLVLAGVSTSGVVLSTLRVAADLDFGITVVSDACADPDEEVHRVLMEKVFPRQAEVVNTEKAVASISGLS